MDINSYLGIILDKKSPLVTSSVQTINNLISAIINKDISIKVATEPNDWKTYLDINGQLIEATYDYRYAELDNSYLSYMKRLRNITMNLFQFNCFFESF